MGKSLRDVMTKNPVTLDAELSAVEAAKHMRNENVGNVLVTRNDALCGIVTDRDLVVRCLADNQDAKIMRLGQLCSEELVTLPKDAEVADAVKVMTEKSIRRVPVVDGKKPIGIVSLGDLAVSQDRKSALGEISAARPNN